MYFSTVVIILKISKVSKFLIDVLSTFRKISNLPVIFKRIISLNYFQFLKYSFLVIKRH